MKIVTVVGARPQFIKAAAVSRAIAEHNASDNNPRSTIQEIIVHTGQHFDANMSDVFFEEMQIPRPNYYLEINSVGHGAMTGRMLEKIEEILLKEKPDYVMVYGDTNSTMAGALAAKKLHIKVVHVEAGLRSFNMQMPEEINRILTDRISDILCCPTDTAVNNLVNEGFNLPSNPKFTNNNPLVINTGDVMQDAALFYSQHSAEKSNIIRRLGLESMDFALCTIHRAENTDDESRLRNIFEALLEISNYFPVVLPLHPRTQKIIDTSLHDLRSTIHSKLRILPPVGYFDMIELLKSTKLVMTDSGGLQKEAFFFKKPCITLRDETEWVELVKGGFNILAGADTGKIISYSLEVLKKAMDFSRDFYGDGKAARLIVKAFLLVRDCKNMATIYLLVQFQLITWNHLVQSIVN